MEKKSNTKFWTKVASHRDSFEEISLKELVSFALKNLTLPDSNTNVERLLQINFIKMKCRNKMRLNKLNPILNIKYKLQNKN